MNQITNNKQYDLEERCFIFAGRVRQYVKKLPTTMNNSEILTFCHGLKLEADSGK